jgi:transcriptional regulator with XRE-family HTH domain
MREESNRDDENPNRTRQCRKDRGLTMGEAARRLGIDVVRLSNVELDREPLTESLRLAMAWLYGVSADRLTGHAPPDSKGGK